MTSPSPELSRRIIAGLLTCTLLAGAVPARADADKDACIAAYELSQRLRNEGKLRASREKLLVCARDVCPSIARTTCADWLADVDKSIPTIVITARDEKGRETDAVKVSVDGVVVSERLDGRPIRIDPGSHSIRYELQSGAAYEERAVVTEGEKNRKLAADFSTTESKPLVAAPASDAPTSRSERGLPTGVFILGGVATVGLVSFAAFAVSGKVTEGCAPDCSASQVSSLRRAYLIADISLGTALVAGGLAVYLALSSRGQAPAPKMPPVALDWKPLAGGGAFVTSVRF